MKTMALEGAPAAEKNTDFLELDKNILQLQAFHNFQYVQVCLWYKQKTCQSLRPLKRYFVPKFIYQEKTSG